MKPTSKYSDETSGNFQADMEANGWEPIRDIFGGLIQWRYSKNHKRVVQHQDALNSWAVTGDTPIPF